MAGFFVYINSGIAFLIALGIRDAHFKNNLFLGHVNEIEMPQRDFFGGRDQTDVRSLNLRLSAGNGGNFHPSHSGRVAEWVLQPLWQSGSKMHALTSPGAGVGKNVHCAVALHGRWACVGTPSKG